MENENVKEVLQTIQTKSKSNTTTVILVLVGLLLLIGSAYGIYSYFNGRSIDKLQLNIEASNKKLDSISGIMAINDQILKDFKDKLDHSERKQDSLQKSLNLQKQNYEKIEDFIYSNDVNYSYNVVNTHFERQRSRNKAIRPE